MNELQHIDTSPAGLPALVRQAADRLARAETAAEVLEAHELAGAAYDAAKRAARLAKAERAHSDIIAACLHAKADALAIEAAAAARLASEYEAAQARGEVKGVGNPNFAKNAELPSAADLGLDPHGRQIKEGRMILKAETANPGAIGRAAHALADQGHDPTRAAVQRAVAGDTPSPRKSIRDHPGTQARINRQRIDGRIWKDLRHALETLSGLPEIDAVVTAARRLDRGGIVDARLAQAEQQLKEFADVWRSRR